MHKTVDIYAPEFREIAAGSIRKDVRTKKGYVIRKSETHQTANDRKLMVLKLEILLSALLAQVVVITACADLINGFEIDFMD